MKLNRIFGIIKEIEKGKIICVSDFAKKFGVDNRTVQRDLKDIEEIFGIKRILIKKGCYSFPKIKKIDVIDKDFEKIANVFGALDKRVLKYFGVDERVLNRLIDMDFIYLKSSPVEELLNSELEKIKSAIKFKKVLQIKYHSDKEYFFDEFKPYKVVFCEGNWYLCGMSNDEINNGFKFLRVNFIKEIKDTPKTFKKDRSVEEFIRNFDTLFSKFNVPKFDVVVKVDEEVSRYFKVKKFHPSQKIIEDNGDLLIKYSVTNEDEIILLAKKWLPYMRVIKPRYIQEELENIAKEFLNSVNRSIDE
jgi:predicted DNA-binding transcriptional regulator YafY